MSKEGNMEELQRYHLTQKVYAGNGPTTLGGRASPSPALHREGREEGQDRYATADYVRKIDLANETLEADVADLRGRVKKLETEGKVACPICGLHAVDAEETD
jgi:hypothetical protein